MAGTVGIECALSKHPHAAGRQLATIPTDEGADTMSTPKNLSHSLQSGAAEDDYFPASELYDFGDDGSYDDDDDDTFAKLGDDVGIDIYDDGGDEEEISPHLGATYSLADIDTDIERLFAASGSSWRFDRSRATDAHAF
jgi:hypothetical protein